MKIFTCSYLFDSGRHVIHVDAHDWEEAQRKLRAIGLTATVDGELVADLPLLRVGLLTRLRRWLGSVGS